MNFIKAFDEYCSIEKNIPAPILRKSFCLDFVPEKADIAICVSGFYDLYLNGKKITKGYLAPYINNPDHILYKDVYDISGEKVLSYAFDMNFKDILIRNNQIMIYNEMECKVIGLNGKAKYEGTFEGKVHYIVATDSPRKFLTVIDNRLAVLEFE